MGGFSQASFRVGAAGGWKRRLARSKLRGTEQWAESGDARLLALDFDGVVVDSVGESSISAYAAAAKKWPDVFVRATEEDRERVLKGLRRVRPCVTTGFENLVQARLLQERQASEEEILANWEQLLWHYMEEWGTTRGELVDTFGQERNDWIEQDFQSWLSANAIYDGVADALSQCLRNDSSLVYIVTTKQQHFVHALLGHLAGIEFPMSRIISTTESGTPKGSVLQELQGKEGLAQCAMVEDKLETLEKIEADETLNGWDLFLAEWGYTTDEEIARAESDTTRIKRLSLADFCQWLKSV